jgi:surface protein
MGLMFQSSQFNQDIGNWNVSAVTTMQQMFNGAQSFNQDLSSWYIINVLNMNSMLDNTAISTINYDNLLIGWNDLATNIGLQPNVTFGVLGLTYTLLSTADAARSNIITSQGWTFVGDSGV